MTTQPPVAPTVTDVFFAVVRLEGKVDVIATSVNGMERQLHDHEQRLRALERAKWPVRSVTTLAAIAAVVVPIMVTWR